MRKKIFFLSTVFVCLAVVAGILVTKGKPRVKNLNPLSNVKNDEISKLSLVSTAFSVTLEKKDSYWRVVEPVVDLAENSVVERVVSVLRGAIIGSVITENAEKHSQFQVDSVQSLAIKLFTASGDQPKMDILMGKDAATFGSSYVRFFEKNPVYLAEGLPSYIIPRTVEGYRQRKIFQFDPAQVSSVTVVAQKRSWQFVRSSDTWVNPVSQTSVDPTWMGTLLQKYADLESHGFKKIENLDKKNGLDKIVMSVEVVGAGLREQIKIGGPISGKDGSDVESESHLVLVEGRPDPMLIQSYLFKDLSDFLQSSH